MGEIAEMMLDGTLCSCCGEFLGDMMDDPFEPQGFPGLCEACASEQKKIKPKKVKTRPDPKKIYKCPGCHKKFAAIAHQQQHAYSTGHQPIAEPAP